MEENVYSALKSALKTIKKDIEINRNMSVNQSVDTDKKIHDLEVKVDSIKENIEKILAVVQASMKQVYTDRELYDLKQELSWQKMVAETKIPLSTLQTRVRRFKKANDLY